jgi:GT2 family glycosyltransferase
MKELINVVITNFNGDRTLIETIRSVKALEGVEPHIIVIDDGSTDGSADEAEAHFQGIMVIRKECNTKEINALRNEGVSHATSDFIFVIDNDVSFEPNCVSELLRVMKSDSNSGVCIPMLLNWDRRNEIYVAGGRIHYLGASISPNRGENLDDADVETGFGIGGGIALFRRSVFQDLGGFDENFMLAWGDDGELHQRMLVAGRSAYFVSTAIGYHEEKAFSPERSYRAVGQLHNRFYFMMTHYDLRTLFLLSPALALYELIQLSFFVVKRMPLQYVRGYVLAFRSFSKIVKKRKQIQAIKVVSDGDVLFSGPLLVSETTLGKFKVFRVVLNALSSLFSGYWRIAKRLLKKRR